MKTFYPYVLGLLFCFSMGCVNSAELPYSLVDLGLDFSEPEGFHGFRWGIPPEVVEQKLGPANSQSLQNGLVTYNYLIKNALTSRGIRGFVFWENKLIGGEVTTFEVPEKNQKAVIESSIGGISSFFQSPPGEVKPGVVNWGIPKADFVVTFFIFDDGSELPISMSVTVVQMTMLHRFLRLTRYGPPLDEVEKMVPITIEEIME